MIYDSSYDIICMYIIYAKQSFYEQIFITPEKAKKTKTRTDTD